MIIGRTPIDSINVKTSQKNTSIDLYIVDKHTVLSLTNTTVNQKMKNIFIIDSHKTSRLVTIIIFIHLTAFVSENLTSSGSTLFLTLPLLGHCIVKKDSKFSNHQSLKLPKSESADDVKSSTIRQDKQEPHLLNLAKLS